MGIKVGWKKDFVEKNTPVMPISGWMGDNLLKKSDNMGWWKGMDIACGKETIHCDTLYDVFNNLFRVPERPSSAPMRMPISGIYKIKGVGDVLAGRVEQGMVKPNEEVVFMPTSGDVMIYKKDTSLAQCGEFNAQIQVLDIPGEIKCGYSPIGFVRCGRSACRIVALKWKMGKETGGKKMEDPHSLKSNEMAEIVMAPQQPLV